MYCYNMAAGMHHVHYQSVYILVDEHDYMSEFLKFLKVSIVCTYRYMLFSASDIAFCATLLLSTKNVSLT